MIAHLIRAFPELAGVFLRYRLIQPLRRRPFLPRALLYLTTHRCNARCCMCGIWAERNRTEDELSLEQLDHILASRLFSKLEYVSINGGEPFLQTDLHQRLEVVTRRCTRLRRVNLTTNGLSVASVPNLVTRLTDHLTTRNILLDVSVSLHGLGEVCDKVYGVPDAFDKIQEALELLMDLRAEGAITLSVNCVLLKINLDDADRLENWCKRRRIPLSFVVGEQRERFRNLHRRNIFLDHQDESSLLEFLEKRCQGFTLHDSTSLRYREMIRMIRDKLPRRLACYYNLWGVLLGHNGLLYACSHGEPLGDCRTDDAYEIFYRSENLSYRRRKLNQSECLNCPPYTLTRWELATNLPRVLVEFARNRFS